MVNDMPVHRYGSEVDSYRGYGGQYYVKRKISGRNFKFESGLYFSSKVYVRVTSSPKLFQTVRQNFGNKSYRQVCFNHINSYYGVQVPVLGHFFCQIADTSTRPESCIKLTCRGVILFRGLRLHTIKKLNCLNQIRNCETHVKAKTYANICFISRRQ